jgi:hypothetical protein
MIAALDEQTRLARVLVSVADPLAREQDSLPPLIVNSFVEVEIAGDPLQNVIRLNRDYVREEETVWLMENGQLCIKEVDIVFEDARFAYIRSGLSDGARVVVTNLATISEGAALRVQPNDSSRTAASVEQQEGGSL